MFTFQWEVCTYNELTFFVLKREGFNILSQMVTNDGTRDNATNVNLNCYPRSISNGDEGQNSMNFELEIPVNFLFNFIVEFKITNDGMLRLRRNDFGDFGAEYPSNIYF